MSNASSKKLRCVLYAVLALSLVLTFAFTVSGYVPTSASADGSAEDAIYFEDFANGAGSLEGKMDTSEGTGLIVTNQMFDLPISPEKLVKSNNYELSFDVKLNGSSELYVHFLGLNGDTQENIYLGIIGNGAYWKMSDFAGHDIYNNSGDFHGGLNGTGVDLSEFASVKFVHYEGYLELWIDGTRRAVSHLSNFGNNSFCEQGRTAITEGTIRGIGIHAQNANVVEIDNVKLTEAVGWETSYQEQNTTDAGDKIFDLSVRNLYKDNFKVTGTYVVDDTSKTDYYPTIRLFGLNASLTAPKSGKEYSVNMQAGVNGTTLSPAIFARVDNADWASQSGEGITIANGDTVKYGIEVYGDNIDFYINDTRVIAATFTDLGLTKGHLQYIKIENGTNSGMHWTDFSYTGYDTDSAVSISASETLVPAGSDVTLQAELFGIRGEGYKWYVNGEEQTQEGTSLTLSGIAVGTYEVVYKNDTVTSNTMTVEAVDKLIAISSDVSEIYATESAVFTAQLIGDFAEAPIEWYVNEAKQDAEGTTFEFSGFAPGNYSVYAMSAGVKSKPASITVLKSTVTVITEKNSYLAGETAVFGLDLAGIAEGAEIGWYVNNEPVTGADEDVFNLDLAAYEGGTQLAVKAVVGGVESKEVIISVVYDIEDKITGDENYKSIWTSSFEKGQTYGTFKTGSDENGTYLYSDVEGRDTHWTMPATLPSSAGFIFEYKLFVPEDISSKCYVYPVLQGLNTKYPGAWMEMAVEVNPEGLRPYFKDQGNNQEYTHNEFGLGKDLSYEGGIAKKGDWNHIQVAVDGQFFSVYINGEMTLFFKIPTAGIPSAAGFNTFPDGGVGVVPVRIKDVGFSGLVQPAPDLVSVSLSVSAVNTEVGKSISVTANLNPFNAVAETVEWYVNDVKVEGSSLTYTFTANEAGTYNIKCKVNGIMSSAKTITVTDGGGAGGDGAPQEGLPAWAIAVIVVGAVAAAGGIAAAVVITLKKKKK